MKKLLALILLAAPLYLAGCDKGGDPLPDADATGDPDATPDPVSETPTEVPIDVPVDVPIEVDDDACVGLTAPTGGICNIVEQCGCMPGYACIFDFDLTACVIIESCGARSGTVPIEGECATDSECVIATSCLMYEGEETGHCMQWCVDSSDCDIAGRSCDVPVSFSLPAPCTTATIPYQACSIGCAEDAGCDLFETDSAGTTNGCPDGQMCVHDGPIAEGRCDILRCIPVGTGALGEECSDSDSGCTSSMGCYGNETDGFFCKSFCDDTHTCSAGTCTTIRSESDPALGICIE